MYNPLRYKICEPPSERAGHPLVGGTGWVQGRYPSALETTISGLQHCEGAKVSRVPELSLVHDGPHTHYPRWAGRVQATHR